MRQPAYPEVKPTDIYFYELANDLLAAWEKSGRLATVPEAVMQRCAIMATGYYQDILSDAGLWRGFVAQCRRWYDRPVPFHTAGEDYVDYELNYIDVAFLLWYGIAMLDMDRRLISPLHADIMELARIWHGMLEERYDDAPVPEEYNIAFELDVNDPEDGKEIARLSHWLFTHSYLLTPAFSLTLAQMYHQARIGEDGGDIRLQEMLEEGMAQQPTGPLALLLKEWIYLILHDKVPEEAGQDDPGELHKFYRLVTEAHGKDILYFSDYRSLNDFFISTLGWAPGEDHLPRMKTERDFAVMVTPRFGMLVARGVARCIADPDNPYYDKAYARRHAIDLLTMRGLCPPDLLRRVLDRGWLPDARFPDCDDEKIAVENADFIARCYLQLFYRGD